MHYIIKWSGKLSRLQWNDFLPCLRIWIALRTVGKKNSADKIGPNIIFTTSDYFSSVSSFAFKSFFSPLSTISIFPVLFSFYTLFQGKHRGWIFISSSPPLKILNISFLVFSLPLIDVLCSLLLWFSLSTSYQ